MGKRMILLASSLECGSINVCGQEYPKQMVCGMTKFWGHGVDKWNKVRDMGQRNDEMLYKLMSII